MRLAIPGLYGCSSCRLRAGASRVVPGAGCAISDIVLVGEAPGAEEDKAGLPFVGRAGELLNKLLVRAGLSRDAVYITNVVKCRPPNNRTPTAAEVKACRRWLEKELELLEPRVIVALGSVAYGFFGGSGIKKNRGRPFEFGGAVVVPTFHPAHLLRPDGRQFVDLVVEDLRLVLKVLGERWNGTGGSQAQG